MIKLIVTQTRYFKGDNHFLKCIKYNLVEFEKRSLLTDYILTITY